MKTRLLALLALCFATAAAAGGLPTYVGTEPPPADHAGPIAIFDASDAPVIHWEVWPREAGVWRFVLITGDPENWEVVSEIGFAALPAEGSVRFETTGLRPFTFLRSGEVAPGTAPDCTGALRCGS